MSPEMQINYEERARIVKSLAHPTRLYIIDMLAQGEKCVCELTDAIGHDMSTVSKHLSLLKGAGIVRTRKQGTTIYYELAVPCVTGFFACFETVLSESIERRQCALRGVML